MEELGTSRGGARTLARAEHQVSRSQISANALKVLYRLHHAGFLSYLVGGAVRDLQLGRRPKDFDIATNARPQQVRQLFRNARVIGRRFRLVMVRFADEIVEVATFRRSPEPPELVEGETSDVLAPTPEADEFGTPEEDAFRRDFTVNALFYNVADFSVIDYVGGLADLWAGVIRTIGPASDRFAEDPVRMMRAVEYGARLGFRLDDEVVAAIGAMHAEIRRASPARIAYELLESLRGGHALPIFRGLYDAGLLAHVVPEAAAVPNPDGLLWRFLAAADTCTAQGEKLGEETLLALLFLPAFLAAARTDSPSARSAGDIERITGELLDPPALRLAFSHYRAHLIRTAFLFVWRFLSPPRSAKFVLRTVKHEAFPVAWQLARVLASEIAELRPGLEPWARSVARVQAGLAPEVGPRHPADAGTKRRRRRGGARRRGKGAPAA
ncbi:MAG: CCA tRNA nucleotidyltransferase [Thermoanaerobaculales bacterium]